MARKSKKHNKSSNATKLVGKAPAVDKNKQLVNILQKRSNKHKEATKDNDKKTNDNSGKSISNLKVEFENVFKAFAPMNGEVKQMENASNSQEGSGTNSISPEILSTTEDLKRHSTSIDDVIYNSAYGEVEYKSKNKLRKLSKPSLAQLKSSVSYPQVIEWQDCDAPDPFFLAEIKSMKNIVPVPSNWQIKREYLSGRSSLEKKPFDLPDLIKATKIEDMRKTLDKLENSEKSLKELSRSAVRPKAGTLDIDFKKLHDVFFKIGVNWKPKSILPYGDLYYEKRNLSSEEAWKRLGDEIKPGIISNDLRNALGLEAGQLPPWCLKMEKIGLPPAYPNMRIAGINWDINNLTDSRYGVNRVLRVKKSNNEVNVFGALMSLNSDEADEDELEENIENNPESSSKSQEEIPAISNIKEQVVMKTKSELEINKGENRKLYTVIKETNLNESEKKIGSTSGYELSQHVSASDDLTVVSGTDTDKNENEEYTKGFKF